MSCVLTLALDDAAQQRFEGLRQHWFPPERNHIPAHLTVFHSLPETGRTDAELRAVATVTDALAMQVNAVRSLGRGVAFFLESPPAMALHRQLRSVFEAELRPQDLQSFRPHVVVQNKVEPDAAKAALAVLQAGFAPWECRAVGLDLWRYLGGPWEFLHRFAFRDAAGR